MHIVYITSEFVTEQRCGGLATYLCNIARIMSGHGHKVTIITLSDRYERVVFQNNINVIRVKEKICRSGKNVEDNCCRLINSWRLCQCLNEEAQKQKIDIVQTANYQAVGFFRNYKIPTIVRVSSDSSLLRNAAKITFDFKEAMKEIKLEDCLELSSVRRADIAFAPSKFCAKVISKRTGKALKIIESPYPNKNVRMDQSLYERKLEGKKYLLFNSSLSYLKGTHLGIEATNELLRKYPDLHLVYAGSDAGVELVDGKIKRIAEILERQNKKYNGQVIYLGKLKQENLFPIVQNALACVLPSRVDNLPNSCIEAMALGKIVIGTYGASFEQLIRNKENGLLIKRDSVSSLIKAIDYLMSLSDDQQFDMGKYAQETIERLNPEHIYDQMFEVYSEVIERFKGEKNEKKYYFSNYTGDGSRGGCRRISNKQ